MNILLTNDDGVRSEGLQKLALVLRSQLKHRVFVIAPDGNRSGISHAVSLLSGPVKLSKLDEDTWSCSGYPADCIIVALMGEIPEKPDLVLSGINQGENVGPDIIYSGTAAAARQASLNGVPAIALSLAGKDGYCWDMAVSWSADHLEELAALWKENTFVNVNIPNCPEGPKGMVFTRPALKHYRDGMKVVTSLDNSRWCFLTGGDEVIIEEEGTDCDAVARDFVSVSSMYNYPIGKIDLMEKD